MNKVSLVTVQAKVWNKDFIPPSFIGIANETSEAYCLRKERNSGASAPESTWKNCSPKFVLYDLTMNSWLLVSATWQKRIGSSEQPYYLIRGIFYPKDTAYVSEKLEKARSSIEEDFNKLLGGAVWQAKVFRNPLYREGVPVDGYNSLLIDLSNRIYIRRGEKPYYINNGSVNYKWKIVRVGNGDNVTVYTEKFI